jgi:WD40-like Beta Propeller Repeat
MNLTSSCWFRIAIYRATALFGLALGGVSYAADTAELQVGATYECSGAVSFKVLSCAGPGENDLCDLQSTARGQSPQRGKSTRLQIATLLPVCQLQGVAQGQAGANPTPAADTPPKPAPKSQSANGKRFSLRLGQGFRFQDGALLAKQDNSADIVFKYLPPQVGGMALRYNPISQQIEQGMEPTLTSAVPLLVAARIKAFEQKPDVATVTTGDIAGYFNQAPLFSKSRFLLLQDQAGDAYLLTLDELEAVTGKYDDWRIGFLYEKVKLPLGSAGGQISKLFPGKLIFRDWYRTKMIMRVDLTTGKEQIIADGILPSSVGERLLGYGDTSGAYVVRDANGKTLSTIRFNEKVLGPVLSPDGTRLAGSVYRAGAGKKIGNTIVPAAPILSTAVFDLSGRETVFFLGYDDSVWTPDGKLIATGNLYEPGLFELDPATQKVRPIDAAIPTPLQPSVSPDGKTIAFITGNKIWLIDRDGANLRQLFPHTYNQQRPVFSPDGTKIAAVICNQITNTTGEVFVIDIATKQPSAIRTSTGASLMPDDTSRLNWVQ